jgi:hypothetical protein
MEYPSRSELSRLARELKLFAFDESPMFKDGQVDRMHVQRGFGFATKNELAFLLPGTLDVDETDITIRFSSNRYLVEDEKPVYVFEAVTTGHQLIHPRQLRLGAQAWHALRHDYLDEMLEDDLTDAGLIDEIEALSDEEVRDEIIDAITDAGDECSLYQKTMLSVDTKLGAIEASYERGVSIDETVYDLASTHELNTSEDPWEAVDTGDGTSLYVPPKLYEDELELGDEVETRLSFDELVKDLGLDVEANRGDFLDHKHKMAELLFIIQCFRKRRIPSLSDLND